MYRHLLVPTDGSELSTAAIKGAIRLARRLGAEVTGFFAMEDYSLPAFPEYPPMGMVTPEEFHALQQGISERSLAEVKAQARTAGVTCQTVSAVAAHPYKAIIETAERRGCDLIVMASHGRKGVSALILGSETNKVLTHSKLPVLVYRESGGEAAGSDSPFTHILIPTDGSGMFRQTVKDGVSLAKELGARTTGFYAASPLAVTTFGEGMSVPPGRIEEYEVQEEQRARAILSFVETAAREAGVECATEFVFAADPAAAIVDAAERCGCDLICMASHGRRGLEALLLGSETTKVLTRARAPVLVLRSREP